MAGKSLDFYQIIFKEEQRASCYPFAKVYFNETLTDTFENDVICKLVPESTADYISVCSWRLKQKRGESSTPQVLNHDVTLTEEKILAQDFDIAILTPRRANYRPLYKAAVMWHSESWEPAFSVFNDGFLRPNGIQVPRNYKDLDGEDLTYAIHENHFIANAEIYKYYVRGVLNPAIEFCNAQEVFKMDSGYVTKKRDPQEIQAYQKASGRMDWPIMPFILERLFSIWINDKGYKVINL
jgi:hypothetical protein